MSILKGIKLKDDSTVHQLDYEQGIANKPKIVKSWNDLEDKPKIVTSYNDLTDKPFEDKGKITISFDGNKEGKEYVTLMEEEGYGYYFIKISDEPIPYNCASSSLVTLMEGEQPVTIPVEHGMYGYIMDGAYILAEFGIVVEVDAVNMDGMLLTKGVWTVQYVQPEGNLYISKIIYDSIDKLDSKYIQDMYHTEGYTIEVFNHSEVYFSLDEDGFYSNTEHMFYLTVGETYNVTWDGVEYKCVTREILDENDRLVYLGNGALILQEKSEEPFMIGAIYENGALTSTVFITQDTSESHSVLIIEGEETIHKVPSKYVDAYTKEEIDTMFGAYVDEVDTLLGGNE